MFTTPILAWTPFVNPLPVWDYWMLLLLPMVGLFSIAYKSIKCGTMEEVPRQALHIFVLCLLGMAAAAGLLWGLVRVREWMV
ncbi:MAG TPA: hypothetical protein PLD59_07005 [Tepidisphaeraceae bacterium]|nr:hypothetical protein [Tepidisphaeraceae bacterium]